MEPGTLHTHRGPRRSKLSDPVLVVIACAAVLALVVALVIGGVRDVPLTDVVEDPAATTGTSPLTGALSNLGVLVGCTGAAVALFSAALLSRTGGDRMVVRFLLLGGLLAAYLTIDDLYLIHDELVVGTPLPQPAFLGLLVLAFAWYLVTFRHTVATTEWPLLLLAGVLFGGSLGIDFLSDLGKYLDAWRRAPVSCSSRTR